MYEVVIRFDKPQAVMFRRWIIEVELSRWAKRRDSCGSHLARQSDSNRHCADFKFDPLDVCNRQCRWRSQEESS